MIGAFLEAINRFKLGIRKVNKNMWLVYPSMINDIPEYVKYRILPFDKEITTAEKEAGLTKFKREKGATSILFNQDALDKFDDVIVTEGERDAISLLMSGYENVVGTTGGAQTLKPEWFDVLKDKEKIHLVFDADEAGQKGAKEVWASRLGYGKCYNVVLPNDMDLTEYFMEGNATEDFNALLSQAKTFNIPGVRPIISILREMADDPIEDHYFPTPWGNVNTLLGGGIRNGVNKPTLFFCMEMSFYQLVRLYVCQCLDKPWKDFRKEDALLFSMQFGDVPIYFGYAPRITPLQIQQTFLEARDRFGIELFVFDNLHTLIREHDHVTERIGAASKMFKDLAMETNSIVLLIAQPRKMEKDEIMHYYVIKGSSDIPADSDIVCLLHRNRTKE
ncbi:MAG: bifunctional DNA primase/helicase, partial [Candidatus Hodarchaeales archaeon]